MGKTSPFPSKGFSSSKKGGSSCKGKGKTRSRRPKGYFVRAAKYRAAFHATPALTEDDPSTAAAPSDDVASNAGDTEPVGGDVVEGGAMVEETGSEVEVDLVSNSDDEDRTAHHDISTSGSGDSNDDVDADQHGGGGSQGPPVDEQEPPVDPRSSAKQVSPGGPAKKNQASTPLAGQAPPALNTPQNVSAFPATDGGKSLIVGSKGFLIKLTYI